MTFAAVMRKRAPHIKIVFQKRLYLVQPLVLLLLYPIIRLYQYKFSRSFLTQRPVRHLQLTYFFCVRLSSGLPHHRTIMNHKISPIIPVIVRPRCTPHKWHITCILKHEIEHARVSFQNANVICIKNIFINIFYNFRIWLVHRIRL